MSVDIILDFLRINVLPGLCDDYVLGASCQEQPTILIKISDVPGSQPAVLKHCRSLLGKVVVTKHDIWPLVDDLSDTFGVRVDDAHDTCLDRNSNRA